MASAILASAMAFIDGTALNVVLPSLQKSLHATGADLFWLLNAYLLMLAWLILGAMPAVLSDENMPSAIRSILLIPPIFTLAAVAA